MLRSPVLCLISLESILDARKRGDRLLVNERTGRAALAKPLT